MARWIIAAGVTTVTLLTAAGVFVANYDFAPFVAARAAIMLERPVAIDALRVRLGWHLTISAQQVQLGNRPGGTPRPMARVESATVEIDWLSLLHGPLLIRRLTADGARIFLERSGDGVGNWSSGPASSTAPEPQPANRAGLPTVLNLQLTKSELVYRTSSGSLLTIGLQAGRFEALDETAPALLTATGSYNGVPVSLRADLAPLQVLRDANKPYPAEVRASSGDTTLHFKGTMTDPLNVDGAVGVLTLNAPTPADIMAIAGGATTLDTRLHLTGPFEHQGDRWQLTEATGRLDDMPFSAPRLIIVEGGRGQPDVVTAEMSFPRLDINALLGEGRRGNRGRADLPLAVDRAPDTLLSAHLSVGKLFYSAVEADDVVFKGALESGRISVETLTMRFEGADIAANGQVVAVDEGDGGRITARVGVNGMDVQRLRRLLGIGALPLQGRMNGEFAVVAEGATLNAASRTARMSAVVGMRGGSISRRLVEIASTDIRSVFRAAPGMSAVSCLVGVVDIRGGAGTVSPLRVRSQNGTIMGSGSFDLNRRSVDLTIGSESATTSAFALDVPVRISGSMADPTILPARWSAAGRAELAASDDVDRLLPQLRPFARQNPCISR